VTKIDAEVDTEPLVDEEALETAEVQASQSEMSLAMAALATSVAALSEGQRQAALAQGPKRVFYHQLRPRTPFNPGGHKDRKLTRRCYQNGSPMFVDRLHDDEIALMNQVKPGAYFDGLVVIREQVTGSETDLHITYSNRDINQVLALKSHFRNLKELLSEAVRLGPIPQRHAV